jgi:plastocyanin
MSRYAALLALLAAAAVAVGCGGSSSSSGSSSTSKIGSGGGRYPSGGVAAPDTTAAAPAATGKTIDVSLQNIAFNPAAVQATVGQTIVWTNKDSVDHNVTATSGATFKSKDFGQGQTYSQKMTKPGVISYVCTIHAGMTGKIVVTAG